MNHLSQTVLVGLGPYAKKHYLSFFLKHGILPAFIIDLQSCEKSVKGFLDGHHLEIPCYFLPDIYRDDERLPEDHKNNISLLLKNYGVTHAIIATEPKAHISYLSFFIEKGINVLVEKPLSAPVDASFSINAARKVEEDYHFIVKQIAASPNPGLKVELQCQRRYHPIYQFIHSEVEAFVKEFDIPITYCDIYHCDGMWNMPNEYYRRENHPYKYGYGKLLHSGYHFIDLLATLLTTCFRNCSKIPNSAELYGRGFFPHDSLEIFNDKDYCRFFNHTGNIDNFFQTEGSRLGELDFFSIMQLYQGTKKITTCSLNLLQTGFSRRSWSQLPEDTYKSNGRIRHERLSLQFGHLFNIQVHSYLSEESRNGSMDNPYNIGQARHFDILLFRNSNLIGGKPFLSIPSSEFLQDTTQSFNELSRDRQLISFLCDKNSKSELHNHKLSIKLLTKSLQALCRDHSQQVPIEKFEIDTFLHALQQKM